MSLPHANTISHGQVVSEVATGFCRTSGWCNLNKTSSSTGGRPPVHFKMYYNNTFMNQEVLVHRILQFPKLPLCLIPSSIIISFNIFSILLIKYSLGILANKLLGNIWFVVGAGKLQQQPVSNPPLTKPHSFNKIILIENFLSHGSLPWEVEWILAAGWRHSRRDCAVMLYPQGRYVGFGKVCKGGELNWLTMVAGQWWSLKQW